MGQTSSSCKQRRRTVPITRCADADVKKADLATKFGITLDSTRGSVKFFDMGAALSSVTVESALFLDGLVDVAADCRNYGNRTSCNALANMVGGVKRVTHPGLSIHTTFA